MKNVMIFVAGMIAGLVLAVGILFQTGHMNIGTQSKVMTYTVETLEFTGLEFQ